MDFYSRKIDERIVKAQRVMVAAPQLLAKLRDIISERDSAALSDDPAMVMLNREIESARILIKDL